MLKILGIVFVILIVLGAAALFYLMHAASGVWDAMAESDTYAAPDMPLTSKALKDSSVTTLDGVTLRLDRYHAHPFLAEYRMVLTVTGGGKETVRELEMDPGGQSSVHVCSGLNGDLVVSGNSWVVISAAGTVRPPEDPLSKATSCAKPRGRFAFPATGAYGFQPDIPG